MSESNLKSISDIASLAKRRGFLFQSSEIYGGIGGCYDYGPLGVQLKNNIRDSWWKMMTRRLDVVGLDSSIIMNPSVWKASGHVDGFSDPMVDCKQCKSRFREDKIDLNVACPKCGTKGEFTEPKDFNLMFNTQVGPVADSSSKAYLRPETAQGIFVNFSNVQSTMRLKLPFGIAQVGKSFRNEITPGNFIFRLREFEQMEMQYFVKPGEQKRFFEEWKQLRLDWHYKNGIRKDFLRWHPHGDKDLAHYADVATDIEYKFPHGWDEMEGIHSRTDFDLTKHQEHSGKSLLYTDSLDNNKKYIPYVIETSVGLDRCTLAVLCDAYRVEFEGNKEKERVVLKLNSSIAPVKVAILPLMKKGGLLELAKEIFNDISIDFNTEFDVAGSIGKRYRRQDEIGTPFCVTIDYDTLEDGQVTIRNRDTMEQVKIQKERVKDYLKDNL